MASTIKVDKIEGSTGSTITVPTGQTLTVTDGIPVASGGTGLASFTQGDILYATGATTLVKLAKGTGLQGLQTNSGATAPEWADSPQSLMTAAGDVLYASGANTLAKLAKGSDDEVLTLASGVPSWAAAGGGTGKKNHHFTMATRTAGSSSIGDQITITSSFIPLDPVNNDLYCSCAVPAISSSNDQSGYGLRFSKDGGSDYDFFGRGVIYTDISNTSGQSTQSQYFNIPAGTIPAGTYTVKVRNETANSNVSYYNPNSTDEARLATQTQTELMIQEWKNS